MAGVEGLVAVGPPVLPKWLLFLRIAIIVLSLATLIAAAINIAAFNDWSYYVSTSGPGGFLIFDVSSQNSAWTAHTRDRFFFFMTYLHTTE